MITEALVKCPFCFAACRESMPAAHAQAAFTCPHCLRTATVDEGDCCVFCKYSDQFCPPMQDRRNGCCA